MTGAPQNLPASKWRFLRVIAARKDLNATDLRVCLIVTDLFNGKKGRAWPSYQYLCIATGAPRSAIARSVKKLHALKIILRISGDRTRSNSYLPDFNIWDGETILPEPQEGWSTQRDSGGPTSGTEVVPAAGPNTLTHPRSTSGGGCSSVPAGGGATPVGCAPAGGAPGFEAFWNVYPKKERRRQALVAYGQALALGAVTPELLTAKAMQYAVAKCHLTDPRWIKSPDNWLREQCWLEDPQPPKKLSPLPGGHPRSGASPSKTSSGSSRRRSGARRARGRVRKSTPGGSPARERRTFLPDPSYSRSVQPVTFAKPQEKPIGRAVLPGRGSVDIVARKRSAKWVIIRSGPRGMKSHAQVKHLEDIEWFDGGPK